MMKLPVFAMVLAALRDFVRFVVQRPIAVLTAIIVTLPFAYQSAAIESMYEGQKPFDEFAASLIWEACASAVWLPLNLIAIRQVVSQTYVRFDFGQPSPETRTYIAYVIVAQLISQLIWSAYSGPSALLIVQLMLGIVAIWLLARTTLTFTALALGRTDLGFRHSIMKTSGQTLRLIAAATLPAVAIVAVALPTGMALGILLADMPAEARLYPAIVLVVSAQFMNLTVAITGAHVYRVLQSPDQSGRY